MKKIIFILICIVANINFGNSQCNFDNFFPVLHGFSKFKSTTKIASMNNIKEDTESNKYASSYNTWEKKEYLKGDSVLKFSIHYDYINHDCFKGDENELLLNFVDDKLYLIKTTLTFASNKFSDCMKNYEELISILKNKFEYSEKYEVGYDNLTDQIGEGYRFYPTSSEKRNELKPEDLSIDYQVVYDQEWNDSQKKWFKNGNVRYYIIEITYLNLENTKLISKSY